MPDRLRVVGDRQAAWSDLPPGQHETNDFPVVSIGDPPGVRLDEWTFTVRTDAGFSREWVWPAFRALPSEAFTVDLHSAAGWSRLATHWEGVPLGALLAGAPTDAAYAHVEAYDEYRTSLPFEDLVEMPTWVAFDYEGRPIPVEHGGPARLLVPHLYLWKSPKWVRAITLSDHDEPGTREVAGAHDYGDPWREQRFRADARASE